MRSRAALAFLAGAGLLFTQAASAEMVIINGKPYESGSAKAAPATEDPLKVKKIFLFPSLDDLSGVLSPKLDEMLSQVFSRNPRFDLVRDPQVLRALSPDDAAYAKAATNATVHREAAKVTGADTTVLLRTRNVGNETEMVLEFRDARGDLLFSETGTVPSYSSMEARGNLIEKLFKAVLNKIPFEGTVTGRTASTLTLDLGSDSVRNGDEVDIARVVSVQRHPLLRTIVGTDYVKIGRARITTSDRALSFAEITEENPGEIIKPGTKVLFSHNTVVRRAEPVGEAPMRPRQPERADRRRERDPLEDRLEGEFDRRKARYGQVGLNLQYGSLTHSETSSGAVTELSGGGFGGNIDGELWVTREWIANAYYGFHNASLSGSGLTAGDTSWKKFEFSGGYRFFLDDLSKGAELTPAIGYQSQKFAVPTPAGTNVGGKSYNGIVLKLDGSLPFLPNQKLTGGFGFQPFAAFSDEGASIGSPDGGNVVSFNLAWNYRFADSFWAKLGMQFETANGNYSNSNSASDKRFAIGPGIYYSF